MKFSFIHLISIFKGEYMTNLQARLNHLKHFNNSKFKYEQGDKIFSLTAKGKSVTIELSNHNLSKLGAGLELVKHHLGDEFEAIRQEVMG